MTTYDSEYDPDDPMELEMTVSNDLQTSDMSDIHDVTLQLQDGEATIIAPQNANTSATPAPPDARTPSPPSGPPDASTPSLTPAPPDARTPSPTLAPPVANTSSATPAPPDASTSSATPAPQDNSRYIYSVPAAERRAKDKTYWSRTPLTYWFVALHTHRSDFACSPPATPFIGTGA